MAKVCTQCGKEWPDQFKFCPECGGDVIEKKNPEAGNDFNISMHGSAVNGGIHKTDSHNVSHNVDSHEIHTTTNNTTQNVTNYVQQAAKSPEESKREWRYEFRQYCEKIIQPGGILSPEGKLLLDEKIDALGLTREEGESVIASVKKSKMRSSSEMNILAKIKLDSAKTSIKLNSPNLSRSLSELKGQSLVYDNEELHFYYNMLLSALDAKQCIVRYEDRKADSYWMAFWAYLAYIKLGEREAAELVLASLSTFSDMPEGNLILLDAAGRINEIIGNEDAKENQLLLLEKVSGDCSDLLNDFKESLIAIYSNKMEKPDFFATYFSLGQEAVTSKKKEVKKTDAPKEKEDSKPSKPKSLSAQEILEKYSNQWGDLVELNVEDREKAFQEISEAAKSNNPAVLFLLSELYLNGYGVKKSVATAFDHLKRASAGGFSHAGVIMGEYYLYGYGVKKDLEEARKRLISAENDNPRVLFLRGELFAAKNAMPIAKIWYQKAADAGSVQAQEKLATLQEFKRAPSKHIVDRYDIIMTSSGPASMVVIKVLKESMGFGLKEAKDLVDCCQTNKTPVVLRRNVPNTDANLFKAALDNAGAKIELKKSEENSAEQSIPIRANIIRVSIENGVSENSLSGAYICHECTIDGMRNRSIVIRDMYFWSAGSKLLSKDDRYKTSEGQLTASELSRPAYDSTIYNGFRLFIPYGAFPLMKDGTFNLILKVVISNGGNNKTIAEQSFAIVLLKRGEQVSIELK